MQTKLFIAGDVVPRMNKLEEFKSEGIKVFDEIKPFIVSTDLAIVNLEAPVITDKQAPIKKSGPNLYTSSSTINVLKEVGFDIVTLANNHFFDQGQTGVENTLKTCRDNKVGFVGGGQDADEARRFLVKVVNGVRVAIVNSCEHEFSIANNKHGGSNPLDLINMCEDIKKARDEADYVVVIVHGGVEHYQYPTPRMKRWYHFIVDLGADAVINHHQHCVNGYEIYMGKPIFYGLGNFYFPSLSESRKPQTWDYGYAVILTLDTDIKFEIIPYKQVLEGICLYDKSIFDERIKVLNSTIDNDEQLQQVFDDYVKRERTGIEYEMMPSFLRNRLFSVLIRRGLISAPYKGSYLYSMKNRLTCESHHEKIQRLFTILTNV